MITSKGLGVFMALMIYSAYSLMMLLTCLGLLFAGKKKPMAMPLLMATILALIFAWATIWIRGLNSNNPINTFLDRLGFLSLAVVALLAYVVILFSFFYITRLLLK